MADFDPGRYYYTAHHIARDFVATAAPLTFICLVACAVLPPVRHYALVLRSGIPESPNWLMLIIAVACYCLFALVGGAIANKAALLFRRVPALKRPLDFDTFYCKANVPIEAWRKRYLPQHLELWANETTMREETIDSLVSYFQIYNPIGFLHVYREYAFLFMYRQTAIYALVLCVCAGAIQAWIGCFVFLVVFVLAAIAVIASISESVHAEYKFIVSTGAWLDRERENVGNRQSQAAG